MTFNKTILTTLLESFIEDVLEFHESVRERPVIPLDLAKRISDFTEKTLNIEGLGLDEATIALKKDILPGLANTAGPRAFPWVIGGVRNYKSLQLN